MRIAFVAEYDAFLPSGVLLKISSQMKTWRSFGVEAQLFLISPPPQHPSMQACVDGWVFMSPATRLLRGSARTYANKILSSAMLKRKLLDWNPEIIYYRNSLWYPGLKRILSVAPFILEVNTIDTGEFIGIKGVLNKISRDVTLKKTSGFVAVSEEIGNFLKGFKKPIRVQTNGFDLQRVQPRLPPDNPRPRLIFAGTPGFRWHGVDKILYLASKLPVFDFHIVGSDPEGNELGNVFMHGYLSQEHLYDLYREMDVAIGTLALYRKKMEQASPLKVREYLALGLPVIIGYDDPDLRGLECVLQIPNDENGVANSIDLIRDFVENWKGRQIPSKEVYSRIDIRYKEHEKLKFIASVFGKEF